MPKERVGNSSVTLVGVGASLLRVLPLPTNGGARGVTAPPIARVVVRLTNLSIQSAVVSGPLMEILASVSATSAHHRAQREGSVWFSFRMQRKTYATVDAPTDEIQSTSVMDSSFVPRNGVNTE